MHRYVEVSDENAAEPQGKRQTKVAMEYDSENVQPNGMLINDVQARCFVNSRLRIFQGLFRRSFSWLYKESIKSHVLPIFFFYS